MNLQDIDSIDKDVKDSNTLYVNKYLQSCYALISALKISIRLQITENAENKNLAFCAFLGFSCLDAVGLAHSAAVTSSGGLDSHTSFAFAVGSSGDGDHQGND